MLKDNLNYVEERIKVACERANRNRADVSLIAVSKTKPIPMLEEVYGHAIRDFGENKVQELCDKYQELPKDIRWHMIGHLQRNKVKYLMNNCCMIHSVDSLRLAQEIDKEAKKANFIMPILIEVNVANEDTKFGISTQEVIPFVREISKLEHISVQGLMTIAPYVENPEENRTIFRQLKKLSVDIQQENMNNVSMGVLSMGMSNDYEVAIEEGATLVRVGTGIFGERNYNRE